VIQAVMGWENYHMHVFSDGRAQYGRPDPELEFRDERKATLHDLLPREGGRARYTYDFGDDWEHEVVVEQVLAVEPGMAYPVCVAGEGACPPEDSGGAGGTHTSARSLPTPPTSSTTTCWHGWGWRRRQTSTPAASRWSRPTGR